MLSSVSGFEMVLNTLLRSILKVHYVVPLVKRLLQNTTWKCFWLENYTFRPSNCVGGSIWRIFEVDLFQSNENVWFNTCWDEET